MNSRTVILQLRQNQLAINGESFASHPGHAENYVQYGRCFNGKVHYEVFRKGDDDVVVRLDDERPNIGDGDELRRQLRVRAQERGFVVGGGANLVIRHSSPVGCKARQFDDIKADVQSRLQDLHDAFESILCGVAATSQSAHEDGRRGSCASRGNAKKRSKNITCSGRSLEVETCREILRMLQVEGAELIGDGVKRPFGKNKRSSLLLCQTGDVLFSVDFKGNQVKAELKDATNDDRVGQFSEVLRGYNPVDIKTDVLSQGRINPSWIKKVNDAYQTMLGKLTSGDKPFVYNKFDWRRKQFDPPKESLAIVESLEKSLLFAMSHGSHELFHTNVWSWLVRQHAEFVKVFFDDIDVMAIKDVRREQGNRDLTIWVEINGEDKAYVVENKFKSSAREDQLLEYTKALSEKFAKGLLVTLDRLPEGFKLPSGWKNKLQADIVDAVTKMLNVGPSCYKNDTELGLIASYASITSQMSTIFNNYRRALGNRWALALNHSEWDEVKNGDLESVRLGDIFKKMNASDFKTYVENLDCWKMLCLRVKEASSYCSLVITTDFLHKLPVINFSIAKTDANENAFIGVNLQGNSFGRCACSYAESWTGDCIYDDLNECNWFDDMTFLRVGLSLMKRAEKKYKKYVTDDYSFVYQDIGIEKDTFEYLSGLVLSNMENLVSLLENGRLNKFLQLC